MTPRYIALEGIDGCGTTTQTAAVARALRTLGHDVVETKEPSALPTGLLIRQLLHDESFSEEGLALLFAADRLLHYEKVVAPALAAGKVVLTDRCTLSSLVYQGLACEDVDWIADINREATWPDLMVLIQVSPEEASRRISARGGVRDRFEDLDKQRRFAEAYPALVCSAFHVPAPHCYVDGSLSEEQVTQAIVATLTG